MPSWSPRSGERAEALSPTHSLLYWLEFIGVELSHSGSSRVKPKHLDVYPLLSNLNHSSVAIPSLVVPDDITSLERGFSFHSGPPKERMARTNPSIIATAWTSEPESIFFMAL